MSAFKRGGILIIKKDFGEIAYKLAKSVNIKRNEMILVSGGLHSIEFLEELVFEIRKKGAFPILDTSSDRLAKKLAFEVPVEYLAESSPFLAKRMEMIGCIISVGRGDDPLLLSNLPESRAVALSNASKPVNIIFEERRGKGKLRCLSMGFPTPLQASNLGMDFEEYHDMFWNAVMIDLSEMRKKEKLIKSFINDSDAIRISSNKGTDIKLSIKGRTVLLDAGSFEEEDFAILDLTTNWPCGEVWVPPLEESVDGVAVFDQVFHRGKKIKNLRIIFQKGKISEYSAEENADLFTALLNEAHGDKDMIAELGIGTNPLITRVTGDCLMDEKMIGTVHLAIGSNRYFGGNNSSTIHKDMVILNPSVFIKDKPLMNEGKLCI